MLGGKSAITLFVLARMRSERLETHRLLWRSFLLLPLLAATPIGIAVAVSVVAVATANEVAFAVFLAFAVFFVFLAFATLEIVPLMAVIAELVPAAAEMVLSKVYQ